jgi:hypothetical protein
MFYTQAYVSEALPKAEQGLHQLGIICHRDVLGVSRGRLGHR